jgi:hypothetical protein
MSWQEEYIDHMQSLAAERRWEEDEYREHQRDVGDAMLDEEEWRKGQPWNVTVGASDTVWVRLVPRGEQFPFTRDEARNLANAILSEIEISQREESEDW